jgi:hypothetical protein
MTKTKKKVIPMTANTAILLLASIAMMATERGNIDIVAMTEIASLIVREIVRVGERIMLMMMMIRLRCGLSRMGGGVIGIGEGG